MVGPLVRPDQVGGQLGVRDEPVQVPAPGPDRQHRALGVVEDLLPLRIGQPVGQRLLVLGDQLGGGHVGGLAVASGDRDRGQVAGAATPMPDRRHPGPSDTGVLGQPLRQPAGRQHLAGQVEAPLGLGVVDRQALQQPVPQHPELQPVEELVDGLPVPVTPGQVVDAHRQVEVAHQGVDLPVQPDVGDPFPERRPGLALDLAGPGDQVLQAVVGVQPLGCGLRADAGDAGQVVAGFADECGQLRVAARRHQILLQHRLRRHPGQVGDPFTGVEHGGVFVDQLEGVPVTGADENIHAAGGRPLRQGADDVVGLVTVLLHRDDVEGVEHFLDQRHLAPELVR